MNLRILFLKFRFKYFEKYARKYDYTEILKSQGIKVGKGTIFYSPKTITIDKQRPCLLEIGEYCKITKGTTILAHDYSRSVLRRKYGEVIGEAKKTIIGNNVFIGMHSIILMGANIGDNVIIGAGSVVTGRIPSDCVVAGNPARVICSLDDYYDKRKKKYKEESFAYFNEFKKRNNRIPTIAEMGAFFPLFLKRDIETIKKENVNINFSGDDKDDIIKCFLSSEPEYNSYEDYIKDAEKYNI